MEDEDKTRNQLINELIALRQQITGLKESGIVSKQLGKTAQEEITKRVNELQDFYDMAVGRELRMIELKEKIEELKKELEQYKKI